MTKEQINRIDTIRKSLTILNNQLDEDEETGCYFNSDAEYHNVLKTISQLEYELQSIYIADYYVERERELQENSVELDLSLAPYLQNNNSDGGGTYKKRDSNQPKF